MTDVLDVHYRDLPGMLSLAATWLRPDRIPGDTGPVVLRV